MSRSASIATVVLAMTALGCVEDEQSAEDVAEEYLAAAAAGDEVVCDDLLAPDGRLDRSRQLARRAEDGAGLQGLGAECGVSQSTQAALDSAIVSDVDETGTEARASLSGGASTLRLVKVEDEWKVDSLE